MIIYDHDSNAILARPLKTKSGLEQLQNIKEIHHYLNTRGIHLLVPPCMHRVNAAENAIDSFKNHFIAGLATLNPEFPMHLWCRLLPLATTTLNLLRPSRVNPKLSAEEFLNGVFDYNKTPISPPGCKVLKQEVKEQQNPFSSFPIKQESRKSLSKKRW